MFVVEGRLALEAVLASSYPLRSVLVLRRRLSALDELGLPVGRAGVCRRRRRHDRRSPGSTSTVGCSPWPADCRPNQPEELLARVESPLLVVVEGVNDQENLGAIFRNAAAFGAGAVFLDPTCGDPLYRRSVRVSLGHVLRVPFARLTPWPAALGALRHAGYAVLALTPSPGAESIEDVACELRNLPVALFVGAEGPGLSPTALGMARQVRVPMAPGVDSLNVAAATAVALYRFSTVH